MIVYNVERRWFAKKEDAETYRRGRGLKPDATAKVEVHDRDGLAALLNLLCEPSTPAQALAPHVPPAIVDRAYVEPDFDIPLFLRKENARRFGQPEPLV